MVDVRRRLRRPWWVGAVVVVILTAVGCSDTSRPPLRVERGRVDGQDAQAVLPPSGVPIRALVVYLHGVTETAAATTDDADVARLVTALSEAGMVVVSTDADGDNFGSPSAQAIYLDTARVAAARYRTHDTVLLAESMGGLSAVPLMASGSISDLRGLVGVSPAINLRSTSSEDYTAAVSRAWGHRPTAADNPVNLPAARFAGARIRFYLAANDTVVPTDQNALPFARRVRSTAEVTLIGCSGGHVDPSCFQPGDVLAYVDGLLGGARPDPLRGLCRSNRCAVTAPATTAW